VKTKYNQLVICNIKPGIHHGLYPIKRVVGDTIIVQADIFTEGHQHIGANLLWRKQKSREWTPVPMHQIGNDQWEAAFTPEGVGFFEYTIEAWSDPFSTWKEEVIKKIESDVFTPIDLDSGIETLKYMVRNTQGIHIHQSLKELQSNTIPKQILTVIKNLQVPSDPRKYIAKEKITQHHQIHKVSVKRKRALFSSWYEIFPRSCSTVPGKHATFDDVIQLIPKVADMGFDVLYFPPIHPIGHTNRKGKNGAPHAKPNEPGSPWAIGSEEGGHKSIHPSLGMLEDFRRVIEIAKKHQMEIACDIAFQCSPDHPYIKDHPEWFKWQSDNTIRFAENPPKKYEDIVNFDFDTEHSHDLWLELKSIVEYWIAQGVNIFRVDNPHTKPFDMWGWLITEINKSYPDVIFLSEAFTRPKVMQQLSLIGFDQSYSYFTWRNSKHELIEYMTELNSSPLREYFRPNFWPNTPDILPEMLQYGGKPAFESRFILAATLSSNYGIYGPVFENCIGRAIEGHEEYQESEKYELKSMQQYTGENISPLIKIVNRIRKEFTALQTTWNFQFCETENDHLIAYIKYSQENDPHLLIIVNIDYTHTQEGTVCIPIDTLGIETDKPFVVHDLLNGEKYVWSGTKNYIKIDPHQCPAHIFALSPHLHEEKEFSYYT
jgi:starch synthase (maltosyl-transferring)